MTVQHRRDRILEAVRHLASDEGLYRVTIARVADRAAVPKSVVLYHFESRGALLREALSAWLAPLRERLEELVELKSMDPRDQLGAWLALHFEVDLSGWRMMEQMALDGPTSEAAGVASEFERWSEDNLTRLLARGHRQMAWRAARPADAAVVIRALVEGLVLRCARAGEPAALPSAHKSARQAVLDLLVRT